MLLAGESLIPSWGTRGRVLWLALCASFCFLTRASEMSAESRSRIRETYCLRRADVAFFRRMFSLPQRRGFPRTVSRLGFVVQRVTKCEREGF